MELPVPLSFRMLTDTMWPASASLVAPLTPLMEAMLQAGLKPTIIAGEVNTDNGQFDYARDDQAYFEDVEGLLKLASAYEPRCEGSRYVRNDMANKVGFNSERLNPEHGFTKNGTVVITEETDVPAGEDMTVSTKFVGTGNPFGVYWLTTAESAELYTRSVWMKGAVGGEVISMTNNGDDGGTVTLTTSWVRYSRTYDASSTRTDLRCDTSGATFWATGLMQEHQIGQIDAGVSEYVSAGIGTGVEILATNEMKAANWVPLINNTVEDVAGDTGDEILITWVDHSGGATFDIGALHSNLEDDSKEWVLSGQVKTAAGSIRLKIINIDGTLFQTFTNTSYQHFQFVFRYDGSGDLIFSPDFMGAGEHVSLKDLTIKQADHNANINGVKIFDTLRNFDTTAAGVVTDSGTGPKISDTTAKFAVFNTGVAADHWSTSDSSELDISGDIGLAAYIACSDWTPAAEMCIMSKWRETSGQAAYKLNVTTSGELQFTTAKGNPAVKVTSTASANFDSIDIKDGQGLWVSVSLDDTAHQATFAYSRQSPSTPTADVNWITLGGVQAHSDTSADTIGLFRIGSEDNGTANPFIGRIYHSAVYDTNDLSTVPAVVFDPNDDDGDGTWTANGIIWTAQGAIDVFRGRWDAQGPHGYLTEETRTNLQIKNTDYTDGAWLKVAMTVDANAGIAPNGMLEADRYNVTASSTVHALYDTNTITENVPASSSIFVRAEGGRYIALRNYISANNWASVVFDLQAGTAGQEGNGATSGTVNNKLIERLPDGWFRIQLNTTITTGTLQLTLVDWSDTATPSYDTNGGITALGVAGEDFLVWGSQTEKAVNRASSVIITDASSVARVKDVLIYDKTGNLSDDVGTWMADIIVRGPLETATQSILDFSTSPNFFVNAAGRPQLTDGSNSATASGVMDASVLTQVAGAWLGGQIFLFIGGVPNSSGFFDGDMGGETDIGVGISADGSNNLQGTIRRVRTYATRLSNDDVLAQTNI